MMGCRESTRVASEKLYLFRHGFFIRRGNAEYGYAQKNDEAGG